MPTGKYKRNPLSEERKRIISERVKNEWATGKRKKGWKLSNEQNRKKRETNIKLGKRPPSNFGKSHSEEHKRKIGLANKGKKRTDETKQKLSLAQSGKKRPWNTGEKNYNWKGGITPINEAVRKSLEYKLWRKAVFERDNFTCVWCGRKDKTIQADHIKPFAMYPELRFAIDNGRTLCKECHKTTNTYGKNIRYAT